MAPSLTLDKEICLAVAGVGLSLRGSGAHHAVLRDERYRLFLDQVSPAATIHVTTAEVNQSWMLPGPEVAVGGHSLSYRTYGGEGYLDAEAGEGRLWMTADVRAAHGVLANFLRVAYALLLVHHDGILFHSAGAIRNGRGYLFYGHSGSGKTTISRLSLGKATLLSDDLVAVRRHDGVWQAHGTPFWGELRDQSRTNAHAPLRGLFSLVKGRVVRLEPLSKALAVADVVSSVPVTCQEPPLSGRLIDLCADLIAQVPCYRLHFTRDDSFWRIVDGI